MMKRFNSVVLCCVACVVIGSSSVPIGAFSFLNPEINLVEDGWQTVEQDNVHIAFDDRDGGSVHAVWQDARFGVDRIFGTTVLRDYSKMTSYEVFVPDTMRRCFAPAIMSDGTSQNMFVMEMDQPTSTSSPIIKLSRYDLETLPDPGSITSVSTNDVTFVSNVHDFKAVYTGSRFCFVFLYNDMIHFGDYIVGTGWSSIASYVNDPDERVTSIDLTQDADGFIYLCYNRENFFSDDHTLIARRSVSAMMVEDGFLLERQIAFSNISGTTGFVYGIAATGSYAEGDLAVSAIYNQPGESLPWVLSRSDYHDDWSDGSDFSAAEVRVDSGPAATMIEGADIAYDAAGRLYAVWTDDREGLPFNLYGSISFDFGMTFSPFQRLNSDTAIGTTKPSLALGFDPGNVAVAFIATEGASDTPYLLASLSEFYDSCDHDPSSFWNTVSGVEIDTALFHGGMSSGASYRLENADKKGELIRDYGSEEQQGVVELYFYDSLTTEVTANLSIGVNNDNTKGIIRMLGVRNDISEENYYYYDGTEWLDWGGARSAGWHHVLITVDDDDGITMQLETSPGIYLTYTDMTFKSFTSVEIEGGTDDHPYHIDDIRIEVNALSAPMDVPVDNLFLVLAAILIIGTLMISIRK